MKNYKHSDRVLFNKDFPILEVKHHDQNVFFLGGVHLKSKFGGKASNNFFEDIRKRQVEGIMKIKSKIDKAYNNKSPFIIAGDFNNDLATSPREFELLRKYMKNPADNSALSQSQRRTFFSRSNRSFDGELDAFFYPGDEKYKDLLKQTYIHKFQGSSPSDHSLLINTIDLNKLIKD
jgi:hypothetical protein